MPDRAATSADYIIGITGASGAAYGIGLLKALRSSGQARVHLVVSPAGWMNIEHELGLGRPQVEALADVAYNPKEVGACIASGSFRAQAMVIAPCSMRTLGAVAHGLSDNLITRAADVMLKERRPLVLLARETPLNLAHLRNMVAVTEMGGIIFPPVPALYNKPDSVQALIDHTVGRVIDLLGLPQQLAPTWTGLRT
ncbi:MAG: UbiX family flavin prenyltransferase [Burkholderiales bacterium]|jgi:4-hydroxy-3-polyprenylbenzoate decarboxylase